MTPRLTDERSVTAVLATLGRGVLADRYEPEVAHRMRAMIDRLPSASDRVQLIRVLRALNTRAGAVALTGRSVPFSWLSPRASEHVLQQWGASRVAARRRLASVFTAMSLQGLYGYPGRAWDEIGYPGPLGAAPDGSGRLETVSIESDQVLYCDVAIVGSGAGGGCAAAVLARAGLDVVVLEKGNYNSESDFHHHEGDATSELYLYGATLATSDLGVRILAGSTLGGGTVVNYTTSFKTPDHVLKQWQEVSGIDAFVSGELLESLDEVALRLGVNTDSSAAGRRDVLLEEGLKKLGWHVDMLPRAVRGCTQDEACGYCGFGCRVGAKQSTMLTFLQDAFEAGARIVTGADVRQVLVEDGRATGLRARVGRHSLRVDARAVVAAGGAIETPALLLRSGLRGQVGHHLRLHPGTAAWATFDDEVRMWQGTLQARYSHEFRHWDGGWGPIFETVPVHPGSWATALAWKSAAHHRSFMDRYRNVSLCAVLPRDTSSGRVRIGRDGNPRIHYEQGAEDERRIADGVVAAGKVLEAAGATEVFSPHPSYLSYSPSTAGAHERWAAETRRTGYSGKVTFHSFHQMGSCRMGIDPSSSAVDSDNQSHEVSNLFVADASAFPTASGVNPMLSVYGIAHRAAKKIAARLS
jgi:choline dehydrogenase-like flavoprotein